jgi:hypothetical protein
MFVDSLTEYIGPPKCVHNNKGGLVNEIWRRSPILFKHVALWFLFIDPHLTTHQSNIGV